MAASMSTDGEPTVLKSWNCLMRSMIGFGAMA